MNNHGKVFTISDANQLESDSIIPKRNKLLNSKQSDDTITTKKIIAGNKPLLFLGNDVSQSISKNQYELILHGITPCGSKTTITIKGIFPYIDVETEVGIAINEQVSKLQTKLNNLDLDVKSIKVMTGKNFMKFHEEQRQYMRVYFNTLKHRLDFIKYCTENNINTFSNDRSTYYRVVARDYEFNLSGWNTIKSYTQVWDGLYKSQYSFTIDVSDISAFDPDQMKENNTGYDRQLFKYEKMIIGSFDIEMIPFNLNKFPDADKCIKDSIFMICVTFHFAKKPESLLSVNLTLRENDPLDDVVTIVCETEACLLLAFSKLFDMVQPEFITEFNGGGFDWRNIITKAEYYGIIPQFLQNMSIAHMQHWETKVTMLSRYYQEKMIKINGATAPSFCKSLKMQGYVNFDTLIMFKQLEPNADSHKLNECLKRCNLGSKDDMDIKEMFRIYLHGTATEMKMVAHYCFIDTFKLQALLLKKNVIQDRRELSTLSMTSIFDAFYFANGSKVRNILMNVGEKVGYKFDTTYKPTIEDPDAKFPGAFVVPPIKGIVRPRLSLSEYIKENNQTVSEKQMRDGYKYIKNNYDAIVSKDLIKKDVPEAIEPYIDYMLTNDTQYPISGLDFASLYPSIMMAYNISPEKLITDESYANQMIAHGYKIHHVTFPFLDKDVHAWFIQHENNPENYGLCPAILIDLFAKRAALKKILKPFADKKLEMEMDMKEYENGSYPNMKEYDEVCFDYEYFNSKQKALKVFMNTFYGELGNFMSFVCAVETAASVTTLGRYNLRLAKSYVEDHLYMKVYYGDSVVGDTPIMLMKDGVKDLVPIEEIDSDKYEQYNDEKECVDYSDKNMYVMTENGYSKIKKLIRHKTNKKLYRVNTHIGSVIVTEDHSLLDSNKNKITPQDCKIGQPLLHWEASTEIESITNELINMQMMDNVDDNIAFVQGFFFGDGSCGKYNCPSGIKYSFALNNQNLDMLNKCVRIFNQVYTDVKLKIIDTFESSSVYKAIAVGNIKKLVTEWRSQFYSSRKHKKVPQSIQNGDYQTKLSFMQGYYAADGDKKFNRMSNKGQIGSQGLLLLLIDLGYKVSVNTRTDKQLIYRLSFTKGKQRCKNINAIKSIEELGKCNGYVYDLETESHHFAAGVGLMVVHNTDSLYVACDKQHFVDLDKDYFTGKIDKLTYCTGLVNKTFEMIEIAKKEVNIHLEKDNGTKFLKMAYEEVLFPVVFVSKKKYFGIPHEEVVNFYPKKPFIRGLEIIKRGASDVLKNVCLQIVKEILDINTTTNMLVLVDNATKRFFTTEWDVTHFIKTAVYRPDKQNASVRNMIARYETDQYHSIPEPNVRFKYVVCKKYQWTYNDKGNQTILSIGDKMELIDRVIEESIPIDLEYYFNNEITGQMARFIAFHDEFNTIDREAISSELTDKERYTKIEDSMFKNAKKYITNRAKEYSNPYKNKSVLFKQTYKIVADSIRVKDSKSKKIKTIYPSSVIKVTTILDGCNEDNTLTYMRKQIEKYVNKYYQVDATISNLDMDEMFSYITDNDLFKYMKDCSEEWISNVVQFIRTEFDYDVICEQSLDIDNPLEIFTRDDLENIISNPDLYVGLSDLHARNILDMISKLVSAIC